MIAGSLGVLIGLFCTPLLIRFLRNRGLAQAIRDEWTGEGNYPEHNAKKGTPSMGGLVIIAGTIVGYLVAHLTTVSHVTASGMLVLLLMSGLGAVGFADDYIKIFKRRSTGVRATTKLLGQTVVAVVFALLAVRFPDSAGLTPASSVISFVRNTGFVLPLALFVIWVWLIVAATSNGVNLTDGLDGLAGGPTVIVSGAFVIISFWQFSYSCVTALTPKCYSVRDPLDIAVVAAALAGATLGFLWWNTSPAQIFMGDTGSLAIGGALAGLAVVSHTELLLVLLGGLFVVVTLSVVLQVSVFKLTKRRGKPGRRILRMAPLQHHFEQKGWGEVTIVIRFWIIAAMSTALGLAIFYAEWLSGGMLK